MKCDTGTILG